MVSSEDIINAPIMLVDDKKNQEKIAQELVSAKSKDYSVLLKEKSDNLEDERTKVRGIRFVVLGETSESTKNHFFDPII